MSKKHNRRSTKREQRIKRALHKISNGEKKDSWASRQARRRHAHGAGTRRSRKSPGYHAHGKGSK